MASGIFGYLFSDWRTFVLYWFIVPNIIIFFGYLAITESPRFYYLKSHQKAVKALNYIAKINGTR